MEVGPLSGIKFGLAPIVWGGDLVEEVARQSDSGGNTVFQNTQRINLRAASYIWQPWFARVNGGIGVLRSKSTASTGSNGTSDSGITSLVGNGILSVLPRSRYPFYASFSVNDSRASSGLSTQVGFVTRSLDLRQSYRPLSRASDSVATYNHIVSTTQIYNAQAGRDTTSSRWSLRHDYHPLNGSSRYGVGYNRTEWNNTDGDGNATSGLQGNYSTSFDKQTFGADARRSETIWSLGGADLSANGFTARHTYRPDSMFYVGSSASIEQSNMRSDKSFSTRYLQANTSTTWHPDADLPLDVTGSGRIYSGFILDSQGVLNTSSNQVVSGGARYRHTLNLIYSVDGSITNSSSGSSSLGDTSNRAVTENGSVAYRSDVTKFGKNSYTWNWSGKIGHQSNTASSSNLTTTGVAGHSLAMPYALAGGASLDVNLSESLLASNDRLNGQNRTLSHAGGMKWRPVPRGPLSGTMTASLSDVRSVGGVEQLPYQAAALGVSANGQASANSTFTVNGSLQWTSNGLGQYSNNANANISYQHIRAFDVKGLRYDLKFNLNRLQSGSTSTQSAQTIISGTSLDQNLDYRIGRANVRLSVGVAKYGNARSNSVMLHLGRSFGNL